MKIVVLSSDEPHHIFLISLLALNFEVVGAIIESSYEKRKRLRNMKLWSSYFWFTYHYIRRVIFGLEAYRKKYFAEYTDWKSFKHVKVAKTPWVNDPAVGSYLSDWKPDIVVICGTSIIQDPILEKCGEFVINIHGGHLPYYRGNHCIFLALYEQEYEKIGATIHFVDRGIDTGDIIEVVCPNIYPSDNAEKIYCRADYFAFNRLVQLLHNYQQGQALPRMKQDSNFGRTFKMKDRTPLHDIVYYFKVKVGLIKIPIKIGKIKN